MAEQAGAAEVFSAPRKTALAEEPRRAKPYAIPAAGLRAIWIGFDALAAFLLMNADLLSSFLIGLNGTSAGITRPGLSATLALAWLAARLMSESLPLGALIGMLAAAALRGMPPTLAGFWQIGGAVILIAARFFIMNVRKNAERLSLVLSIAAGAVSLLALPFMTGNTASVLICLGNAAVAFVLAPVFARSLAAAESHAYLESDGKLCALLSVCAILFGAGRLYIMDFNIGGALAAACVLLVSLSSDSGTAAVAGLAFGMTLALSGQPPMLAAALPLLACAASLARGLHKIWICAIAFAANLVASFAFGSGAVLSIYQTLAACALLFAAPDSLRQTIAESLERESITQAAPQGVAIQWIESSANALAAMARAVPDPEPDDRVLIEQLAQLQCGKCDRKENCWSGKYDDTMAMMTDLVSASQGRVMDETELARLAKTGGCQRYSAVAESLSCLDRTARRQTIWEAAQSQTSRLAKLQLKGQASLLHSISETLTGATPAPPETRMKIARALAKTRWRLGSAMPYMLDGLLQIVLIPPTADEADASQSLGDAPVSILRRALAMDLSARPLWDGLIHISQEPPYTVVVGQACVPAHGQPVSGDSVRSARLPMGRQLIVLSDGMGHGEDAARESGTVLNLLEDGFNAGYGRHELLAVVNDLVRACHGQERYATVDLCVLDMKSGEASFEKMGACSSFLVRQEPGSQALKLRKLTGGTLPMGIIEDAAPKSFRMNLTPRDLLVMVSDGIIDAFGSEEEMLRSMAGLVQDPQNFCDGLMGMAFMRVSGKPADDMTVVAARVKPRAFEEDFAA